MKEIDVPGNPEDEQIIREQIARDHLEIDTITILE